MNEASKKLLEQMRDGTDAPESVEKQFLKHAVRQADRQKWAKMLAEEGISATEDLPKTGLKVAGKPTILRRFAPFVLAAAAAIALLIVVLLPADASFDDTFLKEKRAPVEVRMGANEDLAAWKNAMSSYRKQDFSQAAMQIAQIEQPNSEQRFFLALSLIYQNKPDFNSSKAIFEDLAVKKDAFFEEEARWFLAFCQYKSGEREAAKATLQQIVASKSYNFKKAGELLATEYAD